jgi:hypothetical protein
MRRVEENGGMVAEEEGKDRLFDNTRRADKPVRSDEGLGICLCALAYSICVWLSVLLPAFFVLLSLGHLK